MSFSYPKKTSQLINGFLLCGFTVPLYFLYNIYNKMCSVEYSRYMVDNIYREQLLLKARLKKLTKKINNGDDDDDESELSKSFEDIKNHIQLYDDESPDGELPNGEHSRFSFWGLGKMLSRKNEASTEEEEEEEEAENKLLEESMEIKYE